MSGLYHVSQNTCARYCTTLCTTLFFTTTHARCWVFSFFISFLRTYGSGALIQTLLGVYGVCFLMSVCWSCVGRARCIFPHRHCPAGSFVFLTTTLCLSMCLAFEHCHIASVQHMLSLNEVLFWFGEAGLLHRTFFPVSGVLYSIPDEW